MKTAGLLYGLISYAIGLGGLVYFVLWVGGWSFLPIHINSGTPGPIGEALLVNTGLILLFGLQHSVMARPRFKEIWNKVVPPAIERSTYVLLSGVLMLLICLNWRALESDMWEFENSIVVGLLTALYFFGWAFAVVATFVINHFELFGLRQVWFNFRNQPEPPHLFTDRFLYRIVRHPIQTGILIGIWSTPYMSFTHYTLAVFMTIYVLVGLHFEEIDLAHSLGEDYQAYQRRVPKVVPFLKFP